MTEKEWDEDLEDLLRGLMLEGYLKGKIQADNPKKYTLDTNKAKREYKIIKNHYKHQKSEMNKDRIMRKLSERDYIRKLREEIRDGLCFTMKDEYLGKHPAEYEKLPGTNLAYPFLHATVDMLTASLLHTVVGKVVDDVIDAIIKESNEQ